MKTWKIYKPNFLVIKKNE